VGFEQGYLQGYGHVVHGLVRGLYHAQGEVGEELPISEQDLEVNADKQEAVKVADGWDDYSRFE
jgi:hypothetical protein